MARTRYIKPGFFKNEVLAECQPLARILFAGLWCWADCNGVLEDRPARLKMEILPYDRCDCHKLLIELVEKGFIQRYSNGGKRLIQILNFRYHQRPHPKEPSLHPEHLNGSPETLPHEPSTVPAQPRTFDDEPSTMGGELRSSFFNSDFNSNSCEKEQPSAPQKVPTTPEPGSLATPSAPAVLTFPTVPGKKTSEKEWHLTEALLAQYRETFPAIDPLAECKRALQWVLANASHRKTAGGMPDFLFRWLSKEQDRARPASQADVATPRKSQADRRDEATEQFLRGEL